MFSGNQEVNQITAHIDLLPTLSKLCNVEMPRDRKIDGRSFIPSINSQKTAREKFFHIGLENILNYLTILLCSEVNLS